MADDMQSLEVASRSGGIRAVPDARDAGGHAVGAWPLDAGICSLGRPAFWEPLASEVTSEVVTVLRSSDELSALASWAARLLPRLPSNA